MKSIKRGLAVLLAVLLMMPAMPASANSIDSTANVSVVEEVDVADDTKEEQAETVVEGEEKAEDETVVEGEEKTEDETVVEGEEKTEDETVVEGEEKAEDKEVVEGEEKAEDKEAVEGEEKAEDKEAVEGEEKAEDKKAVESEVKTEDKENIKSEEKGEETKSEEVKADEVVFNTGSAAFSVVTEEALKNGIGHVAYAKDGSYTINIPEANPFFPYEVQFTHDGKTTSKWFQNPKDCVEVGGHKFYVSAAFDNTVATQMTLDVAGKKVTVYPEKKEFTDNGGVQPASLLPLEERSLYVDLSGFSPAELTMVSVDSIFAGENKIDDTSNVIWTYSSEDNYTVSTTGDKLDLSRGTYYGGTETWEIIVGVNDQLASDNIRYNVNIDVTESREWLTAVAYTQDDTGRRTNAPVYMSRYYDSQAERYLNIAVESDNITQAYVSLDINSDVFPTVKYDHFKIYEGQHKTASEAMKGTDITAKICCSDMSKANAGYLLKLYEYGSKWITLVTFDEQNSVTGCLPFFLYLTSDSDEVNMSIYQETESERNYNIDAYLSSSGSNYTFHLYKGYAANALYGVNMTFFQKNVSNNSAVTAAYVGKYSSIADAVAAGAKSIKETMNYKADYSKGIDFTFFIGTDGSAEQKVLQYNVKTMETDKEASTSSLSSSTYVNFSSFFDALGNRVEAYTVSSENDSYAEFNYLTVLVGKDTDLTKLAPVFSIGSGAKLYAAGSSAPEVSGKSYHDFSKGAVQYTVSSEDGKSSKNVWIQVVKPSDGAGKLYINSLIDKQAKTTVKNGVTYSKREVMLDSYHDNVHDILIANIGTQASAALSVELKSDVVELDKYWTLKGVYELSGFETVENSSNYGELPNLAKIRLKAKEGVDSKEVSGTLTIKSGKTTLMVLELTGIIGDPSITTDSIPKAVKYVPYGTMIQNNNKYSWNKVSYKLISGKLPKGMTLKPNGEVYGVPKETGKFDFTVEMDNSASGFKSDTATFMLEVIKNTDTNVDNATDKGYILTERVKDITVISGDTTTQTLVSEGVFIEFVDIYLDGEKLVEGEDYTAKSGSTRITIRNSTLALAYTGNPDDAHTLGIEFRTKDTDVLKRAAQNFRISGKGSSTGNNGSGGNSANAGNNNTASGTTGGTGSAGSSVASSPAVITYTVQSGDSLWKIAEKYYGSGDAWKRIFDANTDKISDPNKIYVGQQLKIYITEGSLVTTSQGTVYVVQPGDSLWKISRKVYGAGWFWKRIYNLNTDKIANPHYLYVGQVLTIR